MITLLPKAGKNMESNKEYIVEHYENGTILVIFKKDNTFVLAAVGELYEKAEWNDLQMEESKIL